MISSKDTVLPILNPFNGMNPLSVVIMDNCMIHYVDPLIDMIETNAQDCLGYTQHNINHVCVYY